MTILTKAAREVPSPDRGIGHMPEDSNKQKRVCSSTKQTQPLTYFYLGKKESIRVPKNEQKNHLSSFLPSQWSARVWAAITSWLTSLSIISPTPLHLLPSLHMSSVYQVFFLGSSRALARGKTLLEVGFALRCFQRFSFLDIATQLWGWPPN